MTRSRPDRRPEHVAELRLESEIQQAIRLELGDRRKYPDLVLWRNNSGVLADGDRYVRFGVGEKGGADLIGIFRGSGQPVGRFIAAEIKTATGRQTPEQKLFGELVMAHGGDYVVLRSVDDARMWVEQLRTAATAGQANYERRKESA